MLLGLLGALALPAAAQDDAPPPPDRPERPDPWTRVIERADQDGDGKISKDEFRGPPERFAEMDKNGDGFLTRDEFVPREDRARFGGEGQRGGPGGGAAGFRRRPPMPGHLLARAADKDRSGEVTQAEWTAFLASLKADENGVVDPKTLGAALKQGLPADAPGRGANREADPAGLFDKDKSGKVELKDLKAFFAELDKNKDGALAKDEMPEPRRAVGGGFGGMMLARVADADRSGDVTADEWKTLVAGITGEDGAVSTEKLAAMLPQRRGRGGGRGFGGGGQAGDRGAMLARALDHDQDGKATSKDLAAIFAELDTNKDGALSADEMPRRRGGRGFGRGPGRGPGPGGGPGSGGEDD